MEREKQKAEAVERERVETRRGEFARREAEREYNAWAEQIAAIQVGWVRD